MPLPIQCGDHAQFEIEHQGVPPEQRPDWPLPSFDAKDWAQAFMATVARGVVVDEALMIGWFANALMRGFDAAVARPATPAELIGLPSIYAHISGDGRLLDARADPPYSREGLGGSRCIQYGPTSAYFPLAK